MKAKQQIKGKKPQGQGFTLIELLVASLMASLFLAATISIVVQVMRLDREETGRSEVQSELTQLMDYIQRDLSESLFVYSDVFDSATGNSAPNGIPDMIEILYDNGYIPNPPNSVPVVSFWKFEPLPDSCVDAGGNLLPAAVGFEQLRNVYVLVTYYLRENTGADTTDWEGTGRITRYAMWPFDQNTCTADNPVTIVGPPDREREAYFPFDPVPRDGFLAWPDLSQTPVIQPVDGYPAAWGNANANAVLASNIFFTEDLAPACPANYSYGGSDPASNETYASFYTCVRQSRGDTPQDIQIFLTGISMDRANKGLFTLYEDNPINVDPDTLSRYLHSLQTQTFSRGVFARTE
ncbi:MAG: prepilin-type N-terminal cleavage/methylation domain-containing protein [Cyanobacteriota bacterium]|nr:prepilin-type N-terminal cleavage/methylation domain-containing protein [Cyanobacteriota bacterium]